jgi:hypothetical protein
MTPETIDFSVPFDPTGYDTISGAQLLQLVSGLAPQAYIGWNVVTDDDNAGNPAVPNAIVTTKWKYYSWIRRAKNGSVILYVWNPAASTDATYLNWQQANISSIVTGSITGSQIAAQTITGTNIALNTIPWGCMTAGATVGGCLTGSLPNPALAASVVAAANIVLGSITGGNPATTSQIAAATIEGQNITAVDAKAIKDQNIMSIAQAGGGLLSTGATGKIQLPAAAVSGMINRVAVGAATWESVLNSFAKDLSGDILTAQGGFVPRVKSDVSGLEMANTPFLQVVTVTKTGADSTSGVTVAGAVTAQQTGNLGNPCAALTLAITPKLAGTNILLEGNVTLSGSAQSNIMLSIYKNGTGVIGDLPLATFWAFVQAADELITISFRCLVASTDLVARNYTFRFGMVNAGTAYFMKTSAGNLGTGSQSYVRATELYV